MKGSARQKLFAFARPPTPPPKDPLEAYRERHKKRPAFRRVRSPKTDPSSDLWFWCWGEAGGKRTTCSNVPNRFAPHWCKSLAFALSKPCECCPHTEDPAIYRFRTNMRLPQQGK